MDENGVIPWSCLAPGGARKAEIWQTSDETAVLAWRPAVASLLGRPSPWQALPLERHLGLGKPLQNPKISTPFSRARRAQMEPFER